MPTVQMPSTVMPSTVMPQDAGPLLRMGATTTRCSAGFLGSAWVAASALNKGVVVAGGLSPLAVLALKTALFGEQIIDELLLDRQKFLGAAPKGGPVPNLVVAGVKIPQHQLNSIQGGAVDARGRLGIHCGAPCVSTCSHNLPQLGGWPLKSTRLPFSLGHSWTAATALEPLLLQLALQSGGHPQLGAPPKLVHFIAEMGG